MAHPEHTMLSEVCWLVGDGKWILVTNRSPHAMGMEEASAVYFPQTCSCRFYQYTLSRKPRSFARQLT